MYTLLILMLAASCTSYPKRGTEDGTDLQVVAISPEDSEASGKVAAEKTSEGSSSSEDASKDNSARPASVGTEEPAAEEPTATSAIDGTRGASMGKEDGRAPEFMIDDEAAVDSSETTRPATVRAGAPGSSGLKAGYSDDNRQYGYFVGFLDEYADVLHLELPIQERIMINVVDADGKSLPNAKVAVFSEQQIIVSGSTTADGNYQLNPSEHINSGSEFKIVTETQGMVKELSISRSGPRSIVVQLPFQRVIPQPIPLDIVFILDTTGSMGEEIARLRATIELIHLNLTSLNSKPDIRFGMVLYKDIGDEYDTKVVPLTGNLDEFRRALDFVEASGGGDTPEDLQAALADCLQIVEWNPEGIRLGFIITDAPPHLDYDQKFTYVDASRQARERGIKLFSVGTGGLPLDGEYILRQISQYTGGKYIFLTYGETGESEGGSVGSVSHHSGTNFQTDKLEAIIIRFAKEELSYLTDKPLEDDDPYFEAVKLASEEREETLSKLFNMALDQLVDYSTYAIDTETIVAILPIEATNESLELDAEYFTEQMMFSFAETSQLTIVERDDIQKVIEEMKLQLSGLTDTAQVTEVGKLLNAQVLVSGKLYHSASYELFLKMLRVESGEVLSVTKAVVDSALGITIR
jgi:hypothetical protein